MTHTYFTVQKVSQKKGRERRKAGSDDDDDPSWTVGSDDDDNNEFDMGTIKQKHMGKKKSISKRRDVLAIHNRDDGDESAFASRIK